MTILYSLRADTVKLAPHDAASSSGGVLQRLAGSKPRDGRERKMEPYTGTIPSRKSFGPPAKGRRGVCRPDLDPGRDQLPLV